MKDYTPEFKAQVLAEWQMGTSKNKLAIKYDIPRGTVQTWTRGAVPLAVISTEKQHDIDALYTDFVAEALVALRTAARLGQDETWLRSIPSRETYLWFGTLADKVLAALSAYQSASERADGA